MQIWSQYSYNFWVKAEIKPSFIDVSKCEELRTQEIYKKCALKQVYNLKFIIKQEILKIKINKLSNHLVKLKKNTKQT